MDQSRSGKAISHSASQEIYRWKPKVHYRVHKSPILSQMQTVHTYLQFP